MATYIPPIPGKTYTIWNKDPVNSVDITNFVFSDTVNVTHDITFSTAWSAGSGATWTPGSSYRGNDTLISLTKTYVTHVGDKNTATSATNYFKGHTPFTQAYTTSSGDKLQVDSTTTVGQLVTIGMAITGGGFTGQTVTAFSATVGWMVLSAVSPTTKPAVGTALTFTDPFPPTLKLVSTASLYTGMTMNGNGFTNGQTVVSIGADSTIVASTDPNTGVYANAIITFSPPAYVLKVNNITGLSAGWYVDANSGGFIYSVNRTILSTSGTEYLIMSGDVGYSNPSGDIKFISNVNKMITLAPNTSATWDLYYDANNATQSNNLPGIIIYALQNGNTVQKTISNIVSINQAPAVTNIVGPTAPGIGLPGGTAWSGSNHSGAGFSVDVNTITSFSDLDAGYAVAGTLTIVTVTDQNGNVVNSYSYSTPAVAFGTTGAFIPGLPGESVVAAVAAIGTDAATAQAVNAAIAQANEAAAVQAQAQAEAAAVQAQAQAEAAAAVGNIDGTVTSTNPDATGTDTGLSTTTSTDSNPPTSDRTTTNDCFDPMALVTMHDGSYKHIKDIVIGDLLMNSQGSSNEVLGIVTPKLKNSLMYSFNKHWAFVSESHPILTTSGWAAFNPNSWAVEEEFVGKLSKIEIGTEIITQDGTELVTEIQGHVLPEYYTIYNLILGGDHTYIVEDCIVHNKKSIVCTAMNDHYGFGSFRNRVWLKYAEKHLTKAHEVGYHTIFLPLVDYGFKQGDGITHRIVRNILEHIARHRSTDIRAEMRGLERNTLGRAYRFVLEPLCYIVGKLKGF